MRPRLLLVLPLACVLAAQDGPEQRIRKDLQWLASPALKGRGNGYPELDRTADYVAASYRALGLKPLLQRFPFVARVERERARAALGKPGAPANLAWGRDVEALGFSGDGAFQGLPLVHAGAGEREALSGLELKGRVAVMARALPASALGSALERALPARLRRLEAAGAQAVLVLEEGDLPWPLQREEGPLSLGIPVLSVPRRVLEAACGPLNAPGKLDAALDLDLKLRRPEAQLPNVAAILPGRDPALRQEYIVLGAHMDHLGLGERHSMGGAVARGQVHPGADDNGSGTAMVLELARELAEHPPRRSVLFLNFSGEEEGLLGSAHWIQHPTVPLPSVKFMVNFDMVGRLSSEHPKLLMGGLGAPESAMALARKLAPAGLEIAQDIGAAVGGSDHMSFAAAKIPTFFFFTGLHADYHRPSDTAERINVPGMTFLAAYAKRLVEDLADGDTLPAFDPETAKLHAGRSSGPMRIAFGTIPDFAENAGGYRISGASPGSTAEALGLRAGDVLVDIGGHAIKGIYDFMDALSAFKPGDRVTVKWLREGREMRGEAVLRGR